MLVSCCVGRMQRIVCGSGLIPLLCGFGGSVDEMRVGGRTGNLLFVPFWCLRCISFMNKATALVWKFELGYLETDRAILMFHHGFRSCLVW